MFKVFNHNQRLVEKSLLDICLRDAVLLVLSQVPFIPIETCVFHE